jgi:hypothetical protein
MRFIGSTKLHRKSGVWGTRGFVAAQDFHGGPVSSPVGQRSRWKTEERYEHTNGCLVDIRCEASAMLRTVESSGRFLGLMDREPKRHGMQVCMMLVSTRSLERALACIANTTSARGSWNCPEPRSIITLTDKQIRGISSESDGCNTNISRLTTICLTGFGLAEHTGRRHGVDRLSYCEAHRSHRRGTFK